MDGWTNGERDGWTDRGTEGQREGGTDGWTDKQNFSPFYRTLSPVGAAAQKEREGERLTMQLRGTRFINEQ